jgi:ABC-type multidrug transport system ATPase subunit
LEQGAQEEVVARRRRYEPVAAGPPPALTARGLGKAYGDLVALQPTDLDIEAGQLVALIGHNGSGKSTFLRLCAGQLDATEGWVTVDGHDAGSVGARAALSYLPDSPVLYDDLSLWEHLEYLARLHGAPAWEDRADELLDVFGLDERRDDLPVRFSRGLRQKSALVLGLLRPFDVLLIDEPFVGLDASGKTALIEQLEAHHEEGRTVVVATHDLHLLELVDRCIALRDGEVVHDGPIDPGDVLAYAG